MRFEFAAVTLLAATALVACEQAQEPAPMEEPGKTEPTSSVNEAPPAAEVPAAASAATPSPEAARVFFVEPADGATVSNPVKLVFGIEGLAVAPAGDMTPDTGHHHLLIDEPEVDMSKPLPVTAQVVHFGKGQTETEIELPPGEHTLQLMLGDFKHQPHDPPVMSDKITITVEDGADE